MTIKVLMFNIIILHIIFIKTMYNKLKNQLKSRF